MSRFDLTGRMATLQAARLRDEEEQFQHALFWFCAGMVAATLIFVAAI